MSVILLFVALENYLTFFKPVFAFNKVIVRSEVEKATKSLNLL